MSFSQIIPVILCGGSGSRLWPLSRHSYPKQFLSINSSNEDSLLQKTVKRIFKIKNLYDPILLCNEEHRFIVAEQIRELGIKPYSILLEPFGRNTAPAITIAALKSQIDGKDPIIIVLSSDHEILDNENFIEAINLGVKQANQNKLVTFGIIPSSPETGYGYIKSEKPLNINNKEGSNILEFIEKPNLEVAKQFVKNNQYTWNSGIFIFKSSVIIDEINKYYPDLVENCKISLDKSEYDLDFQRLNAKSFEKCREISIDVAVMEKTDKGFVLPLNAGWSDIGSWEKVWDILKKDKNGNVLQGKTYIKNSKNCLLKSDHRLVVGLGIEDLVIIETNDAILVSSKHHSQEVKNIVQELKDNNISEGQKHLKTFRPWGHYISTVEGSRWQVKLICVKPSEKTSLQMHHHRSEHWIVVSGTAEVEIDNKLIVLSENQSTYIPLGSKHRLSNPGKIPLVLIEVQSGAYVGEDDIVRFEDKYGRDK
tara:strand:+ start:778 stop:2217 length:1440 start_codon:yes stop_codon:yes gene_type:complete